MTVVHKQGYSGVRSEMDVTLCGRWGHFLSHIGNGVASFYGREDGHFNATLDNKKVTCKRCRKSIDRVKRR